MKKALSLLLSAVLLITAVCSTVTLSASAELPDTVNFLDQSLIIEGKENVTVNADGSWTVSGPFTLAPNVTFEYAVHQFITLDMTTDSEVKITLLDSDPEGVYGDHWIGLYDNWYGPQFFPAGTFNETNGIQGIYNWMVTNSGWKNIGLATFQAIYFEFKSTGTATIRTFNLNNGNVTEEPEQPPVEEPETPVLPDTVNFLDESLIIEGKENITVNNDGSWTVSGPFTLAPNVTFEYAVHQFITLDMTTDSNVSITMLDRDPEGVYGDHWINLYSEWYGPRYFPAGDFNDTLSIYGTYTWNTLNTNWKNTGLATFRAIYFEFENGIGEATIRAFNLNNGNVTVDPEPTFANGDVNMDGRVSSADARAVMMFAIGGSTLTDEELALADYNKDGKISTSDARGIMLAALYS